MTPAQLKSYRLARGLSLTAIAKEMGMSRRHYIRLESGDAQITRIHRLALKSLFASHAVKPETTS